MRGRRAFIAGLVLGIGIGAGALHAITAHASLALGFPAEMGLLLVGAAAFFAGLALGGRQERPAVRWMGRPYNFPHGPYMVRAALRRAGMMVGERG